MSTEKDTRINEDIASPQVRLIGADGDNLGVVRIQDALLLAEEAELDLVEIVPTADPPVCRVMDFGKFKFELSKKTNLAKKKQKQVHIKEVKFRPGTDEGDYQIKLRNLKRFLEEGDKTKVTIRFRGREMTHMDLGSKLLDRIEQDLGEYGTIEQRPKVEGRQMVTVFSPKKK